MKFCFGTLNLQNLSLPSTPTIVMELNIRLGKHLLRGRGGGNRERRGVYMQYQANGRGGGLREKNSRITPFDIAKENSSFMDPRLYSLPFIPLCYL